MSQNHIDHILQTGDFLGSPHIILPATSEPWFHYFESKLWLVTMAGWRTKKKFLWLLSHEVFWSQQNGSLYLLTEKDRSFFSSSFSAYVIPTTIEELVNSGFIEWVEWANLWFSPEVLNHIQRTHDYATALLNMYRVTADWSTNILFRSLWTGRNRPQATSQQEHDYWSGGFSPA